MALDDLPLLGGGNTKHAVTVLSLRSWGSRPAHLLTTIQSSLWSHVALFPGLIDVLGRTSREKQVYAIFSGLEVPP